MDKNRKYWGFYGEELRDQRHTQYNKGAGKEIILIKIYEYNDSHSSWFETQMKKNSAKIPGKLHN